MQHQEPTGTVKPYLVALRKNASAIVVLAVFVMCIGGLGYGVWDAKVRADQRWLEGMDLENFNPTQMEVWRWCWKIGGMLEKASEEIGGGMTFEEKVRATSAFTPQTCKYLNNLRAQTRREKMERGVVD